MWRIGEATQMLHNHIILSQLTCLMGSHMWFYLGNLSCPPWVMVLFVQVGAQIGQRRFKVTALGQIYPTLANTIRMYNKWSFLEENQMSNVKKFWNIYDVFMEKKVFVGWHIWALNGSPGQKRHQPRYGKTQLAQVKHMATGTNAVWDGDSIPMMGITKKVVFLIPKLNVCGKLFSKKIFICN